MSPRSCCGRSGGACSACGSALCAVVKFILLTIVANKIGELSLYNWMFEPLTQCQQPPLPVNQSGVKVMVYGMAKTGTKSITKALHKVGVAAHHSEDFLNTMWVNLADTFWRRPENGGAYLASSRPPAYQGVPGNVTTADVAVLNGTTPAELAAGLSRCRIEAAAFDGVEKLFWPTYEVSPGTKVVSMSWRTYAQYRKSSDAFQADLALALLAYGMLLSSSQLLPYSVVVVPVLEALSGGAVHNWLSTGHPPPTLVDEGVAVKFFRQQVVHRRWVQHVFSGLPTEYKSEEEYQEYFEEARRRVPPGDLMEWDMKRNTMKDLCDFLGIKGRAECNEPGPLPKGINVLHIERETPLTCLALMPLYMFMHYVNWKLVHWLFRTLCCCRGRGRGEKKEQ